MGNPFFDALDRALRGKRVFVVGEGGEIYIGWLDRIHHQTGAVVLHDTKLIGQGTPDAPAGSVYARNVADIIELDRSGQKRIKAFRLQDLEDNPLARGDFDTKTKYVQRAYRNGFVGSFPVVSAEGIVINGHKRLAAAREAGLERHPVEVVDVDRNAAMRLYRREHTTDEIEEPTEADGEEFEIVECPGCDRTFGPDDYDTERQAKAALAGHTKAHTGEEDDDEETGLDALFVDDEEVGDGGE